MKKLSIYIHIPFCVQKCAYCDFLSAPADDSTQSTYIEALFNEIAVWQDSMEEYEVDTVFFGGGTPSCLANGLLEKVLCKLKESFLFSADAEVTVEVNPGTVDVTKLEAYFKAGVNRLSIGLQSPFEEDLRVLGRIHDATEFMSTYNNARQVGFRNINIDLMSALPGQSVERYKNGLHKIAMLEPEHISAYSLIIEENTPFYHRYANHRELLPDEDAEREMYEATEQILSDSGYHRYEISNYAKKGYECRHNLVYWQGGDYLGLGLGASSMLSHVRFKGIEILSEYLARWNRHLEECVGQSNTVQAILSRLEQLGYQEIQLLSVREQMEEFMFLGLRCMEGVKEKEFESRFGVSMQSVYGKQLTQLANWGLMEKKVDINNKLCQSNNIWLLTPKGIDVSNMVFAEFI